MDEPAAGLNPTEKTKMAASIQSASSALELSQTKALRSN
jgi:ABC-type branched-subunit amino acid transport system ATPase component